MADADKLYILADTVAACIMPDGSTQEVTIERPNDLQKPYEVRRRVLKVSDNYRDPSFRPRNGYRLYELEFILTWQFHRMDLTPLLVAERINLKVPTYFYKDDRYYSTFNVQLQTEELSQMDARGMTVKGTKGSARGANPLPNAAQELRFITDPYTWDEFLTMIGWFNPATIVAADVFNPHDNEAIIGFVPGETGTNYLEPVPMGSATIGAPDSFSVTINGTDYNFLTLHLNSDE